MRVSTDLENRCERRLYVWGCLVGRNVGDREHPTLHVTFPPFFFEFFLRASATIQTDSGVNHHLVTYSQSTRLFVHIHVFFCTILVFSETGQDCQ